MADIEIIARGVCVDHDRLLLCSNRKKNNVYLPGGHIEWGESGRTALRREIEEEMGLRCKVGRFLGVAEHTFVHKGEQVCEINLVYAFVFPRLTSAHEPPSIEKKLRFFWLPLDKLARSRLEPRCLARALGSWLASGLDSKLVTARGLD